MTQQQIAAQTGALGPDGNLNVYTVPGAVIATPVSASVIFDGSSAAGAFIPCLTFKTQTGAIIARCPASEVAAGDTAEVSWFPSVGRTSSGPAPSGGIIPFAYITGTTNKVCNSGATTLLTTKATKFYTNSPATFSHGTDVSGNVGITITGNGHYWQMYHVTPFGVPTAGSFWVLSQLGGGNIADGDWFNITPLTGPGGSTNDWQTTDGLITTVGDSVAPPTDPIIGSISNTGPHNVTMGPPTCYVWQIDTDNTDLF